LICTHTILRPVSSEFPDQVPPDADLEICYSQDGYLTICFADHEGGGIVFEPEDVQRLRDVLGVYDKA